ncbi:MAG: SH3 domain-containing protein [Pseudonocardiaceae bacterium]
MARKLLKRWRWLVGGAVVVSVVVLSTGRNPDPGASGSLSCTVKVTADTLNVRSGPDSRNPVVGVLAAGEVIPADPTISNGFRQLGPNRWAAQLYLEPTSGSNCSGPVG